MKYYIESLGCAKNLVDSERFAAIMKAYGFREVAYVEDADLILVNSCAFLMASYGELDEVLSQIDEIRNHKKSKLVVSGCVMNRGLKEFQELFPEVNKWIPLKDYAAFERYLLRYVLPKNMPAKKLDFSTRQSLQGGQHVYLRIADGCENFCSYCMIPHIRGKLVSEPIEALVKEAKAQSSRGRELVLIAQDSCMYGTDIYGEKALPKLIEALHDIPGYDWIRIMYMHPDHFDPEWTELWKKYPKLLPYFEIPIQHSCDRIIKLMNRQKGYQELKEVFGHIKQKLPEAVFRTTIMVNYPSETKQERSLIDKFLQEVDILHAGVFAYSPEVFDKPYEAPEGFDWARNQELETEYAIKLSKAKEEKMQSFVGTRQQMLVEGFDEELMVWYGRLWFQAPEIDGIAYVEGLPEDSPLLVEVEVVDALTDALWCTATKD
ncbi:MAG: MiaB/RimO family radical SAM methylthiotransferase [Candidatus Cloacimonetes bacterium]|jgi:ribosomal protein S12 methylthiotransferase|nr:MiaB/RimO family radical SAM methylthiotransferase [Candidatus Cloacimonadota bacterium]MDD2506901.1 MiaB/RimO family radical SAM methylthiotransferase [Candidatus Cloacimonadota bacterium]MDD4560443.1 MiaB/RimO family radical SAM methylthiotransferase [Candidatus Cloacimonadota bacterium]